LENYKTDLEKVFFPTLTFIIHIYFSYEKKKKKKRKRRKSKRRWKEVGKRLITQKAILCFQMKK
jgi:hypothetical protein